MLVSIKLLAQHELEAGTEPDIAVRIAAGVVEVQRCQACIAAIRTAAAAIRESKFNTAPLRLPD